MQIMQLEKEIQQVKPFRNYYHKATVNVIYSGKWMLQFVADVLKPYKLTLQQFNILRILRGRYPEAISVLSIRDKMLDRMSDTSRIIEHLRKKGLAERTVSIEDRRRVDVLITQKGMQLLNEIEKENEELRQSISKLEDQLTSPEQDRVSLEQFLNLSKNTAAKVKAANEVAKDKICQIIFLNFTVDEEKVVSHLWKEPYATLIKSRELSTGRGDRT